MMNADLAQRQLEDYDRREPGLLFVDDRFPLTEAEAYRLQLEVAALREQRGESVAGYKIGCVSETMRRQLGMTHPVFGHVFANELHASGCTLDHTSYAGLAIEGELAVRIGQDIPNAHWLEHNWPRAVSAVFPVIELHNYVIRSSGQKAQELIANNGIHAGAVLASWQRESLTEPIAVSINGEVKGSSATAVTSGLILLVERLAEFGIQLKAGRIALTGSPLPLYRVQAGDAIAVSCGELPAVTANIR